MRGFKFFVAVDDSCWIRETLEGKKSKYLSAQVVMLHISNADSNKIQEIGCKCLAKAQLNSLQELTLGIFDLKEGIII